MTILKRKNTMAHRENTLQVPEAAAICCGDVDAASICNYEIVIDTSSVTTASKISLGGTEYNFPQTVSLTTEEGLKQLQEAIDIALHAAGYTNLDSAFIRVTGEDELTITTSMSQVSFDYLQASANEFSRVSCSTIGNYNTTNKDSNVGARLDQDAEEVVFTPAATIAIANVAITASAGGLSYDGPNVPGGIRLDESGVAAGTVTYTTVLTFEDESTATHTNKITHA